MSIKIITDSTSYIPKELIEKYDITVVSLGVVINNIANKEIEIENDKFYKTLEKLDSIPTSSQPSVDDLFNSFDQVIGEGHEALGVFISSEMSGTYATCNQLIKTMIMDKYPKARMEVIDSASNCMQMGYAVLEAVKLAQEGKSMEEVIAVVEAIKSKSRFLFVPDTLEYLKKGGRIGGAAALFGALLQIRPILTVEAGKTSVFDKVRTKQKAILKIIEKLQQDIKNRGLGQVIVHHINCEEEGRALANKIKEILGIDVDIQCIGPVIGCHVGPKTVGVVYYTEK